MKDIKNKKISGLILAGGLSRRMKFSDKSLKSINKNKLIELVYYRAKKQVNLIAINSNNIEKINGIENTDFLKDIIPGSLGPLVGILTGLEWINKNNSKWLATFPVDSPFFPCDLIEKLALDIGDEKIILAQSGGRTHPVFGMWHKDLKSQLIDKIKSGVRKIDDFVKNYKFKVVNFEIIDYDPFFNINNKDDLLKAEKIYNLMEEK